MSDPSLSQVFQIDDSDDELTAFFSTFSLPEINKQSSPERRDPCFTDPGRLKKTVALQNTNEVAIQGKSHVVPSVVEPAQVQRLDDSIVAVTPQVPANQPLVSSSGGNAESLASVPIPSAEASDISVEELGATPEDAASAGHASARRKKERLWERTVPFDDPVEEKKRKNAIKAKKNRIKRDSESQRLKLKAEQVERSLRMANEALKKEQIKNAVLSKEIKNLKELLQAVLGGRQFQVCYVANQQNPQK